MELVLKVLEGGSAGREIKVSSFPFKIGRGDNCQLRPRSDMVSREHCEIIRTDDGVSVQDVASRNGTIVNGEKADGAVPLKAGDQLRVGPLLFEIRLDFSLGGPKKDRVKSVGEAAARVAESAAKRSGDLDGDVSSWLTDADDFDAENRVEPDTRQFKIDETDQLKLKMAADEEAAKGKKKGKEKKEYGKLPVSEAELPVDSREAAQNMLKKFFERR